LKKVFWPLDLVEVLCPTGYFNGGILMGYFNGVFQMGYFNGVFPELFAQWRQKPEPAK
jgi:hypothetical protein